MTTLRSKITSSLGEKEESLRKLAQESRKNREMVRKNILFFLISLQMDKNLLFEKKKIEFFI